MKKLFANSMGYSVDGNTVTDKNIGIWPLVFTLMIIIGGIKYFNSKEAKEEDKKEVIQTEEEKKATWNEDIELLEAMKNWKDDEAEALFVEFMELHELENNFTEADILFIDEFPKEFSVYSDMLVGVAMYVGNDSIVRIYIPQNHWKDMNAQYKKNVIFHELGHDVLNLEHSDNPKDLMHYKGGEAKYENYKLN